MVLWVKPNTRRVISFCRPDVDRVLEAGMDIKVLSSILGHAQASTTLNLYAHALPDHKKQSMEKMSSFYGTGNNVFLANQTTIYNGVLV